LASIHPALLLLAVFAVPTVLTSTWRPEVERSARERGAQTNRLARHLFTIATTAPPGKEVRVTGIGERLVTERRAAWERWYGPVAAARWGSAVWRPLAWATLGCAYVGGGGGGGRGRPAGKRRRHDCAGQAAREDVRAVGWFDPRGRHAAGAPAGRRVAGASSGRVPGFFPLRIPRGAHGRFGRRPPAGRRARSARGC